MRHTSFLLTPELFDAEAQQWFVPMALCYEAVTVKLALTGGGHQRYGKDFRLEGHVLQWLDRDITLTASDDLPTFEIFGGSPGIRRSKQLAELLEAAVRNHPSLGDDAEDKTLRRIEQVCASYPYAQQQLDEGNVLLALILFGTALEALLDRTFLSGNTLNSTINQVDHPALVRLKDDLHWLRERRNHIHAVRASTSPLLTIDEGQRGRSIVERVLKSLSLPLVAESSEINSSQPAAISVQ